MSVNWRRWIVGAVLLVVYYCPLLLFVSGKPLVAFFFVGSLLWISSLGDSAFSQRQNDEDRVPQRLISRALRRIYGLYCCALNSVIQWQCYCFTSLKDKFAIIGSLIQLIIKPAATLTLTLLFLHGVDRDESKEVRTSIFRAAEPIVQSDITNPAIAQYETLIILLLLSFPLIVFMRLQSKITQSQAIGKMFSWHVFIVSGALAVSISIGDLVFGIQWFFTLPILVGIASAVVGMATLCCVAHFNLISYAKKIMSVLGCFIVSTFTAYITVAYFINDAHGEVAKQHVYRGVVKKDGSEECTYSVLPLTFQILDYCWLDSYIGAPLKRFSPNKPYSVEIDYLLARRGFMDSLRKFEYVGYALTREQLPDYFQMLSDLHETFDLIYCQFDHCSQNYVYNRRTRSQDKALIELLARKKYSQFWLQYQTDVYGVAENPLQTNGRSVSDWPVSRIAIRFLQRHGFYPPGFAGSQYNAVNQHEQMRYISREEVRALLLQQYSFERLSKLQEDLKFSPLPEAARAIEPKKMSFWAIIKSEIGILISDRKEKNQD